MTTLAELTATISSYLDNDEPSFVANLDGFVRSAEDRLSFGVHMPAGRYSISGVLTAGSPNLALPSVAQSVLYINIIDGAAVSTPRPVQSDFIVSAFSGAPNGMPKYYAVRDAATLLLGPAPAGNYPYTLHYTGRPPSLVDNPTGTWMSTNLTNALKWAAIIEAYTYMKGDASTMALYETRLAEAQAQARLLVESKLRTDSARNGEPVLVPPREL